MKQFDNYDKGIYLGSDTDMAHNNYDAYRVDDEIHIVYENGQASIEKIKNIKEDMDKYLWTPFVKYV